MGIILSNLSPGWTCPLFQQMALGCGQQGKGDTVLPSCEGAPGGFRGPLGQCALTPGLWPAPLLYRAHCIQLQTPRHCINAAELKAVQRRAGEQWGVAGPGAEVAGMKQPARLG